MKQRIVRREPASKTDAAHWPADLHPVLQQVYRRRAVREAADLDLSLSGIAPVGGLDRVAAAVDLLLAHRQRRIVVFGDYDSDGATSTALMLLCLRELGFADVQYFVPDRFDLGYGLSAAAVQCMLPLQPSLIVTVDNGISSVEGVSAANAAGIEVLITDHHAPPDVLPDAAVIVNPNLRADDGDAATFPGHNLAGVGVAFYVLAALGRALNKPGAVAAFLDLVALGTVADLVRLDRGNRILVHQGLARIRAGHCRPGITALCQAAGCEPSEVTAQTLGFQIAPRLNAAGRLEDMSVGVACLLATTYEEAWPLAEKLDALNRSRRQMETAMREQAMQIVDSLALEEPEPERSRRILVLSHPDWHEGLVGLIASRVRERYGLPSFAFAAGQSLMKGSGRSVQGFHLRDALADADAAHPGIIDKFGGHAMAAGLSLRAEHLDDFKAAIEAVAMRSLDEESLNRDVHTDGELADEHISLDAARAVRDGGPWGQGFPEPLFDGEFTIGAWRWLREVHLRLDLHTADGTPVEAIAFNSEFTEPADGQRVRIAYRLSINTFRGDTRLQLIVEHCEPIQS